LSMVVHGGRGGLKRQKKVSTWNMDAPLTRRSSSPVDIDLFALCLASLSLSSADVSIIPLLRGKSLPPISKQYQVRRLLGGSIRLSTKLH